MSVSELNVRLPQIGELGEGTVPQACYDELVAVVQDPPTSIMLTQLVRQLGREGVAFVTNSEDGITVFDDGNSEIVFALGKDVFEDADTICDFLKGVVRRYYIDEGPEDDSDVMQALVSAVASAAVEEQMN
jgi:hypothetical protein